jgi:hypothetical protein
MYSFSNRGDCLLKQVSILVGSRIPSRDRNKARDFAGVTKIIYVVISGRAHNKGQSLSHSLQHSLWLCTGAHALTVQ